MEEERYVITPKGIAYLALSNIGINLTDSQLDAFYILFEHYMRESGYIVEDNK